MVGNAPGHLLFATDFSARCDRAQNRAIRMALDWNARLTAVHAIDEPQVPSGRSTKPPVPPATLRNANGLRKEFAAIEGLRGSVIVERGNPGDVILEVASRERCDQIVTGIAGNGPLGQTILGSTVTSLVRHAAVPVLVVKKKRAETDRVVVASDLSEASQPALEIALRCFPRNRLVLFHSFGMPYRDLIEDKAHYEESLRAAATEECRRFLSEVAGTVEAERIEVVARHGRHTARLLGDYVADHDVEMVIAGTQGRTALMNVLLGSVAADILNDVQCDILIVPSRKR